MISRRLAASRRVEVDRRLDADELLFLFFNAAASFPQRSECVWFVSAISEKKPMERGCLYRRRRHCHLPYLTPHPYLPNHLRYSLHLCQILF